MIIYIALGNVENTLLTAKDNFLLFVVGYVIRRCIGE